MSFCVCDSICPQSHLCDIPWSLFATSLSSCFPCLFVCCSKFHQLSRLFAIPLSSFFSPSLILCLLFCLPPSPTCYVRLHTLYTTILFSGFSPHLLYICYNSIFQLSHLYYPSPPLHHNPVFFLLSLPYFVSMILFATHNHLYDSLPSTTVPCLCSYPLPQFCVCYYCDWCFCVVVVRRDKVSFIIADHPPYNSSLSQYMPYTPVFSLVPLPSFVSVIPFTNTSTCIFPASVPLLVFSLTPPILCVCHSLHQHFHLYLPSLCATPCLLSNPSPPLCQLFLSPTLQPVSPLPLCDSLSSL